MKYVFIFTGYVVVSSFRYYMWTFESKLTEMMYTNHRVLQSDKELVGRVRTTMRLCQVLYVRHLAISLVLEKVPKLPFERQMLKKRGAMESIRVSIRKIAGRRTKKSSRSIVWRYY